MCGKKDSKRGRPTQTEDTDKKKGDACIHIERERKHFETLRQTDT